MKNKIDRKLEELKKEGLHGLMAHIVIGYPDLAASERLILTLADSGADLIEMQIPFTDPLADGPTILAANLKALKGGVRVADCFRFAERVAAKLDHVPLLFMTYINIPFNYGMGDFCHDSQAAGLSGLIIPDIPPEEKTEDYHGLALNHLLHPIYILSPSSTPERIRIISRLASGFLYCTARVGITGARTEQVAGLKDFISRVRKKIKIPLALGFGISNAEQVRMASELAEVSVVGSKVIDIYNSGRDEGDSIEKIKDFFSTILA